MKRFAIAAIATLAWIVAAAQENDRMKKDYDRIQECRENYTALFGGEALTGKGSDPEMMDILQKFIFGDVFSTGKLERPVREMITCTVLSALQTLPQLKAHAGAALNVGVTPLQLREIAYLCAPFIGFPRTLNAISTIDAVLTERGVSLPLESCATTDESTRHERGALIRESLFEENEPSIFEEMPGGYGEDLENFLTDYCFGDIYTRSGLDLKTKEMLVLCIITSLGQKDMIPEHVKAALRAGNTREELVEAIMQCLPYTGFPLATGTLVQIRDARP